MPSKRMRETGCAWNRGRTAPLLPDPPSARVLGDRQLNCSLCNTKAHLSRADITGLRRAGILAGVLGLLSVLGCPPVNPPGVGNAGNENVRDASNANNVNGLPNANNVNGPPNANNVNAVPNQNNVNGVRGLLYFPAESIWYEDVSNASLDAQSDAVVDWLQSNGGWGGGRMQIDFSIEVLEAGPDVPLMAFTPTDDFFDPDCDLAPVPVPPGGALEGESGYACESDGDCHLIVLQRSANRLYEMWRANIVNGQFFGGCLAVWDTSRVYGPEGRGDQCTSADAAGYPIAPLLFTADEVAAGSIDHAIRFIVPNARIRSGVYVHPATHSTGATRGPDTAPPYGTRLRLRADYPLDQLPNEGARVVARAMQRFGMFLSDAGNIALTAQSDRFTTAKWDGLLGPRDLDTLQVSDFEMLEAGERIVYTGDCVRTP